MEIFYKDTLHIRTPMSKLVNIYSYSVKTNTESNRTSSPVEEVGQHHLRSHQGQAVQGQCSLHRAYLAEHSHAHHRHQAANKRINVSLCQLGRVRDIQEPSWLAVVLSAMNKQKWNYLCCLSLIPRPPPPPVWE